MRAAVQARPGGGVVSAMSDRVIGADVQIGTADDPSPANRQVLMPEEETPSLYDRLGGVYNIAVVVDDLIDRVTVDARLNVNPRVDEAHHRVSPAGFKYYVTEVLCGAAGGPQVYTGRSMGDSHRNLLITENEWRAFIDDLQQSLDRFQVLKQEQQEVTKSSKAPGTPS